jgi:hypothetical protein
VRFEFADRGTVYVRVRSEDAGRGTYLAVAPPIALLRDSVTLPDGSPLPPEARVTVDCDAELVAEGATAGAWYDVPVHFRIALDGFEKLVAEWRPRVGAPPRRVLTPR